MRQRRRLDCDHLDVRNGVCGQIRQPTEEAVLRQLRVDSDAWILTCGVALGAEVFWSESRLLSRSRLWIDGEIDVEVAESLPALLRLF